jgi:hypothetical protein
MKQFTDVALTAIPQPFELVSDSANVNYRGALDNGIVWDMYQALHAELQDANGIACYPGATFASLQSTFRLAQRKPGKNKEGRISINVDYFNDKDLNKDGRGDGISHESRQAIEQCFADRGRLYVSVAQEKAPGGLALYIDLHFV